MTTAQEAIDQFKAIIGTAVSWAKIAKSQFVEHMAVFLHWALQDAQWKIERAKQEFFLATALNDSSIMAQAEGREYVPRKATPSSGMVRITNSGTATVVLPANTQFVSASQLELLLEGAVAVPVGGFVDVEVLQLSYAVPLVVSVEEEKPFWETLFPAEVNGRLAKFSVSVDEGNGFQPWAHARLFQNSLPTDGVYDEFFYHNGQTGIRFGNGIFGKVPVLGSVVKVEYWTTEGDKTVIANQPLQLVGDVLDLNGAAADLSIVTTEAISGGGAAESIAEMRINLHYWPRYNHKLVWADDYAFFIKSQVAGITWINCWGEQQQEAVTGFDVQNINKIFVSAYAPGNAGLSSDVMSALASYTLLNRKYQWVAPIVSVFTVQVTGKISRGVAGLETAIQAAKDALAAKYGSDSLSRSSEVNMSNLYAALRDTGYFDGPGAYFKIEVSGITEATQLQEFISIDIASSTFDLTYQ